MDLPSTAVLGPTLKPGTVYLMDDDVFNNGLPHYVVVINKNILKDPTILLVSGTSKIDKRKQFVKRNSLSPKTLIVTDSSKCHFLKMQTVFDCNCVMERTIDEIEDKSKNGKIRAIYEVSDDLLNQIREGVLASRLIVSRIKKLLL